MASQRATVTPDRSRGRLAAELQRTRVLDATALLVAEQGVAGATVANVAAAAGVSRNRFYELFEDREQCFVAAFDRAVSFAAVAVAPVLDRPAGWRERLDAVVVALTGLVDREPEYAALCLVHALGAGPTRRAKRELLTRCPLGPAAVAESAALATQDDGRCSVCGAVEQQPPAAPAHTNNRRNQ